MPQGQSEETNLIQAWAQSTCPELSAQGLVPLRWGCALPSPNAPGKAPNHIDTTLRWGRAPGKPSRAGAFWAQTEDPSGGGAASPRQGRWDPASLHPALRLGGQATAWDCSPGRSLCLTKSSACVGAQVSLSGVHLPPLLSRCHRCSSILRVAIRAQ